MFIFTLTFLLGICTALQLATLPNVILLTIIFIITSISFLVLIYKKHDLLRYRSVITLFGLMLGFCWALLYLTWQLHHQHLPDHLENQKMSAVGYIASVPAITDKNASFLFQTTYINHQPRKLLFKVSWHWQDDNGKPQKIHVGDQWKLKLKVKRPHDMANHGSFSAQRWAIENKISASGYILEGNLLAKRHWYQYPIDYLRERLQTYINQKFSHHPARESLLALLVGIRTDLTRQQWDILQRSGTNHLMAIAGLHIGMVATFWFFLGNFLWRIFPRLTLILPAQQFAAYLSLTGGLFYSLLVGFSLPTRRAMIMLGVVLLAKIYKRNLPFLYSLLLALLTIIIIDPLATLSISFWLSFVAVGCIIYGSSGRLGKPSWWHHTVNIQWQIFIGLIPITLLFFNGISLISPLANIVTVPWLGLIILPLIILGAITLLFSAYANYFCWHWAMKNLTWLWQYLDLLVNQPWLVTQYIQAAIPHSYVLLLLVGAAILAITPRGFWGKYLALILALPIITWQPTRPLANTARLTLLDVGQGLSAVIQTRHHILIFDAGAKLSDNYDMGNSVIVPWLRMNHVRVVDALVISHEDNDHIGGAISVLQQIPVSEILTSVPQYFLRWRAEHPALSNQSWQAKSCYQGQRWHWDGVEFTILSPAKNLPYDGNDSSCVLKVSVGKNSVLLTGDIGKKVEQHLVNTQKESLSASILVASHHGSKTSSSEIFLRAVNPQYILFATGYRNRFNFPHQEVVARCEKLGIKMYSTSDVGAITFTINNSNYLASPNKYREMYKRIWDEGK